MDRDEIPIVASYGLRIFLGVFGAPFLFFGLVMSVASLTAAFQSGGVAVGIFGFLFGLPFVAVGGLFVLAAIRGPGRMGSKVKDYSRRRFSRLQSHMDRTLAEAGVGQYEPSSRKRTGFGNSGASAGGKSFGTCPQCGASITDESLISPSGDVCCDHCRTWFRIRA
ncbi:MAG: hypothetical protein AAGG01_18535 [Planctomycetota bacterium]